MSVTAVIHALSCARNHVCHSVASLALMTPTDVCLESILWTPHQPKERNQNSPFDNINTALLCLRKEYSRVVITDQLMGLEPASSMCVALLKDGCTRLFL